MSSSSSSPKSKIFAKFNPTLGESLNKLANSAGVGVARISPVAVRTTPFIAEGMQSLFAGRVTGVARDGNACELDDGFGVGIANCRRWEGVL